MNSIARKEMVQEFLEHLQEAIKLNVFQFSNKAIITRPLLSGLKKKRNSNNVRPNGSIPALNHLPLAIKNAKSGPPEIQVLADSLERISNDLLWYQRTQPVRTNFMRNHANAYIIGDKGLETHDNLTIGVSLLAPMTQYPNHKHPPEELYLAVSEGDWRQEGGPWEKIKPGGLIYNQGNIVHSMRAKSQPLLTIWCLWNTHGGKTRISTRRS